MVPDISDTRDFTVKGAAGSYQYEVFNLDKSIPETDLKKKNETKENEDTFHQYS